jgi:hypothetical protein
MKIASIIFLFCLFGFLSFTAKAQSNCTYTLNPTSLTVNGGGGDYSFNVTTQDGCAWTATTSLGWITITSGNSGSGSRTVNFTAAPNAFGLSAGNTRGGTIAVNDQTFTVNQPRNCPGAANPTSANFAASGGTGSFFAGGGQSTCPFTVTSNDSWIILNTSNDPSVVSYSVAPNTGIARTGTITVNSTNNTPKLFTVNQAAGPQNCTYSLNPTPLSINANGGNITLNILTQSNCTWNITLTENENWVQITNGSGTGNGTVNFTVGENLGPARFVNISLNGEPRTTIFQKNGCRIIPSTNTLDLPAPGGAQSITYQKSSPNCGFALSTSPAAESWLKISDLGGSYSIWVDSNSGAARSTTVYSRADLNDFSTVFPVFTANQDGPSNCTYTVNPTELKVPQTGGNYSVNITTQDGCYWTARFDGNLGGFRPINLTFTSPTSGIGSGRVDFTVVSAPTQSNRSGSIFVNNAFIGISQEGICDQVYYNPVNTNFPREGGQGSFSLFFATITCSLSIQSNAPWIALTGVDSEGKRTYAVAPNEGQARTGTISLIVKGILGLTQTTNNITISQAAGLQNCTYSISTTRAQITVTGGGGNFGVATQAGCNWTATSNVDWITTTSNGSGNGTVNYSVQQNTGAARSGTITVAGQTFTVNQSAACSYSLSSSGITTGPGALSGTFQIITSEGCAWSAQSSNDWITIASGIGNGSGTVVFNIQPNSGAARVGIITAGGQIFTVSQSAATPSVEIISIIVRAVSRGGKPVRGAIITYTNVATGETRTTVTNQFGYFRLTDIAQGQMYNLSYQHKRYTFSGLTTMMNFYRGLDLIVVANQE